MYCEKCGKEYDADECFCAECGNKLVDELKKEKTTTGKSRFVKIIITFVVIVTIGVGSFFGYKVYQKQSEKPQQEKKSLNNSAKSASEIPPLYQGCSREKAIQAPTSR